MMSLKEKRIRDEKINKMVESCKPLVYSRLRSHKINPRNENYDDYISEINAKLVKVALSYDESRAKFSTYAYKVIDSTIKDYRISLNMIRIPAKKLDIKLKDGKTLSSKEEFLEDYFNTNKEASIIKKIIIKEDKNILINILSNFKENEKDIIR